MKKRLLSLLMTAGLLLGLVPAASAAGNSSLVFLDGEVTPQVKLKQGNYTRYIDRFDFGANTYEMEFYQIMEEATDNDGVDDYFIDDKYFDVASFGPDGHLKDDPNSRIQYYSGNFGDGTSYSAIGIPMELECGNLTAKEKGSEALLHFASVYEAFDRDHPEVFWLSRKYLNLQFTHEDSITFCFILWADRGGELFDLRETDYRSENRIKADIARLNQAADGILKGAASCENNYEKILYFNDRLTKTNAYNTIIAEDLDAYDRVSNNVFECLSALTGKSGTEGPACEGYSKALKVLCDRSGIACVLENGTATSILGSGRHMWNSVQVDRNGPWYAVDITWNDPIGRGDAVVSGIESTEWLLVGRNTVLDGTPFRENHVANNNIQGTDVLNGPELSSGAYPIYRPAASVSGSVASAAVSSSMGSDMVSQAKSDQSGAVVIAPEGKGSATALEVTIPGATVKQLADSTDADVRLDMVYADLVIPNETLAGFDGKDLTVSVAKTGSGVSVDFRSGTASVDSISGGVTVEIPYSNCTSGTVASLVQKDGTREVVRTSVADPDTGRVCLTLDGPAQVEIQENAKSFNDVGSNAWFADAVAFVCSHELMQGTGTGTFAPNAVTTRAAIAMMLYNLEKNPAVGGPAFTDTKAGAWYTDAITWASENKLVNGYGKGIFGPDDAITREQMAVILYNYAVYRGLNVQQQGSLGAFQDSASVSNWATTALRWAVSEGLVNGDDGGNLNPGGSATRAQVATVLMRFCDVLVP